MKKRVGANDVDDFCISTNGLKNSSEIHTDHIGTISLWDNNDVDDLEWEVNCCQIWSTHRMKSYIEIDNDDLKINNVPSTLFIILFITSSVEVTLIFRFRHIEGWLSRRL